MAAEYLTGGSADEITLRRNRWAFDQVLLHPRVMRDVSRVDPSVTLLGRRHPHPILLAPVGYHRLFHEHGELETARGAAAARATMVLSSVSNTRLEDVARVPDTHRWYQIYVQPDRGWTAEIAARAAASGFEALMLTVDTPVLGSRDREKRTGFALPAHLEMPNFPPLHEPYSADRHHVPDSIYNKFLDATLTWDAIGWLKQQCPLPVFVKGVLAAADARLAIDHGADGIVVSNHGGRNLDTVPATLECLPRIVETVGGRVSLLLDGGIRRGTDIVKALAMGAGAVMIGRPYVWGLAEAGAEGIARVVKILELELMAAMALLGVTSIGQIDREVLWRPE
jgi:4-hydroxymandelate oxidase